MYEPDYKNFNHFEFDNNALTAISLIKSKNWNGFIDFYTSLHPSERHHAIDCCSYFIDMNSSIGCEDRPEPELQILLGAIYTRRAFVVRGFGRSDDIKEEHFLEAQILSQQAHKHLDAAISQTAYDTTIYGFYILADLLAPLVTTEDGEEYKDHNKVEFCVQLMKESNEPANIFAAQSLLLYDSPKWFGSVAGIHQTAEELIGSSPNAAWYGVKAQAMFETWLWYVAFEEDKIAQSVFFNELDSDLYKKELQYIQEKVLASMNDSSIPNIERIFAHNHLANLLCRLSFYKQARCHLRAIDKKAMYYPWSLCMPAGKIYRSINIYRLKSFLKPIRFS